MVKGKLRILEKGQIAFYCEGCQKYHYINISGENVPVWGFNGDYEKPTFTPSIHVTNGPAYVCHSFITDGKIQYLSDCTHELAGQTVELKDLG